MTPDWLGASRRAASALRLMLAERVTIAERVIETGTRGEGGDRTLEIDALAEEAVLAELQGLYDAGARFTVLSEEAGTIDFGGDDLLVVVDPIDGSLNAKRGLPHHCVSIAVAEGPTMADVVFGFVQDFGPDEEWVATRGGGATLNGLRLDPAVGERRWASDGKLELVGFESADPRWVLHSAEGLVQVAHRLRAIGTIAAAMCQVAAGRFDGMLTLKGCRAVDAAAAQLIVREAGGHVAFTRFEYPLEAPLDLLPHSPVVAARSEAGLAELGERAILGQVIDWSLARQVARGIAGLQPAGDREPFEQLSAPSAESERLVSAYTGLAALTPLPTAEAVDRDAWIDANLRSLGGVLDPVSERIGSRLGPLGGAAGALLGLEAGAISGFLGGRVLGQYEFPPLDPAAPARLLFVTPNLGHAANTLEADPDQLLRWVALHETTHALQFAGVPWLREHLAGLIGELLGALDVNPSGLLRLPDVSDLRALFDRVRDEGLAFVAVGEERRGQLESAQAFMALLEGYAEHVMDAVGADLLSDLEAMREAMERRRHERTGLLRVLEKLIGMDLKMRQYQQGKAFCDAVVARGGIEALNRAWAGPEALPAYAELDDPVGWLARTERLSLGRGAA